MNRPDGSVASEALEIAPFPTGRPVVVAGSRPAAPVLDGAEARVVGS